MRSVSKNSLAAPEVRKLDVFASNKYIFSTVKVPKLRFDVSVENPLLVHVVQGLKHHVDDVLDSVYREVALAVGNQIEQTHVHQLKH